MGVDEQAPGHGRPAEYRMRIALANVGPLRIELIEPLEGDTVYAEFVREHGYGVHHLGLLLDTEALLGTTLELIERPKDRVTPEKLYPPPPSEPA